MPISNIPTFVTDEIPSAAKLNQLGTALTTKFSGGVTGSDLVWPLVAQGAIDMNSQHTFTNLRTLWNVVNVDEYDTFSDAEAALPATGGTLFIPAGTTVTTDGNTLTDEVCILGCGKASVLKLTTSASSGYLIRTATDLAGVDIVNVTIDGNAATGSGQDGIQIRKCSQVNIVNCWFKNFSGDALSIGNDGTGGNASQHVRVIGCHFEGGSGNHIELNDVDGLVIDGCYFENPTTACITGTPSNTSAKMRSITVSNCQMDSCAQFVDIVGGSATANDLWRLVRVCDNLCLTSSGDGITVGDASAIVKYGYIENNTIVGAGGDGIVALLQNGRISDNDADQATGDGLDMTDCQDIEVKDNRFANAGAYGIDSTNSDDCYVHNNNVAGSANAPENILKDGTTGNSYEYNSGDEWSRGGKGHGAPASDTLSATGGTFATTYTFPANSIKAGDRIRFKALITQTGTDAVKTAKLMLDNVDMGAGQIEQGAGNSLWTWEVAVVATTNDTDSMMEMTSEMSPDPQQNEQVAITLAAAVDWTTDILADIDATISATDTLQLKIFEYEVY